MSSPGIAVRRTASLPLAYDRANQYSRDFASKLQRNVILDHPVKPGDDGGVRHAFSVSKNRTGSPVEGVSNSPCHITRRPRTKVPTGQPVTSMPS
jgi:hypothetical protein